MKLLIAYTNYFLIVAIFCLCWHIKVLRDDLFSLRGTIVDIDKVRADFAYQVEYFYVRGCKFGVDYPPEYRKATNMFNPNSPINYCVNEFKLLEDYVTSLMSGIGK